MIKRITHIILLLCVLLTVAFPCFADFQPDSNRWVWCGSTDKVGLWVDSLSFYERPVRDEDIRVHLWALYYINSPTEYIEKIQYAVDLKKRVFTVTEFVKEDMDGNVLFFSSYTNPERRGIVPSSNSELFYRLAVLYHKTHNSRSSI